jgi:predicted transcriptional regulator of viral defense system
MMPVDTLDKLYQIAEAQAGYFTTGQAEAAGVDRPRLSRNAAAGRLQRVRRGVYRLTHFPRSRHEDLFIAWLETGPHSVISHDSALGLYDLSDALPAAIHVTVPRTASRRRHGLRLHTGRISPEEITSYEGLPVTTVARTIADVALEGLSEEVVEQAVREAISAGLVQPEDLLAAAGRCSRRVRQVVYRALERVGQLPIEVA